MTIDDKTSARTSKSLAECSPDERRQRITDQGWDYAGKFFDKYHRRIPFDSLDIACAYMDGLEAGSKAHGNETRAGNQPDPYVSGLAQAGIRAERDRRIIERHVRWHDEALRLLQQVNTGYEGEWPEIADFVRRSTARIEQSSSEKAAAPQMAMLPNDHHPGPRCSCGDCQRRYPESEG